jgi:hypothetical protein
MNLDAIKKKLESMQKQPSGGGSNNQTKRFKPQVGKQTVRVVPFKYNKEFPFKEMKFYYGIGSKKVIASPFKTGVKKIQLLNLQNNFVVQTTKKTGVWLRN